MHHKIEPYHIYEFGFGPSRTWEADSKEEYHEGRQLSGECLIVLSRFQMMLGNLSRPLEIKSQALFMVVALCLRSPGA